MTRKKFEKLKVGDKVKANKLSNDNYSITTKENKFEGVVTSLDYYGFNVKGTSKVGKGKEYNVEYKYFDKVGKVDTAPVIAEHIVKDNKVIVKLSNGKVGVAKCSPDDEFDVCEGTKIALLRAYGKESEVKEVKRQVKEGDYIKLTKPQWIFNRVGDILKVSSVDLYGVRVKNCDHPRKTAHDSNDKNYEWCYNEYNYVVLENYKPAQKKKQLTLDNGEYGVVGDETNQVDIFNNKLCVGDVVMLIDKYGSQIKTIICSEYKCDFVMGAEYKSFHNKNGRFDEYAIVKTLSYKEFKDGDYVNGVKFTLTEV